MLIVRTNREAVSYWVISINFNVGALYSEIPRSLLLVRKNTLDRDFRAGFNPLVGRMDCYSYLVSNAVVRMISEFGVTKRNLRCDGLREETGYSDDFTLVGLRIQSHIGY